MKLAFITDTHIGPTGFYKGIRRKLSEYSELYIQNFVKQLSSEYEFAIQLGDLIQDDNRDSDLANYKKGLELFSQSTIPIKHIVGNHDTIDISQNELKTMLGLDELYYSFDAGNNHFIALYTHVYENENSIISDKQKDWLVSDLQKTDKPTVIFSHHSLADQNLFNNPWFSEASEACLVKNRIEIRRVLADSGKVIAVVNGHLHWNNISHHDGIAYITVQSAIENYNDDGRPANAWGTIEILDNRFSLEVYGDDPLQYKGAF